MSRIQLRPALRAYAHAPAGAAAEWTPASISGLLLWLDASDESTLTYTSGTTLNTVTDKVAGKVFVKGHTALEADTISGEGNGLKFFKETGARGAWGRSELIYTPTSGEGDYFLTSGAGSMATDQDWTIWQVSYADVDSGVPPGAGTTRTWWQRGLYYSTPFRFYEWQNVAWTSPPTVTARSYFQSTGDWVGSTATNVWYTTDTPAWVDMRFKTSLLVAQCFDDSGTRKVRFTQTGSSWRTGTTSMPTPATPSSANNKWSIVLAGYQSIPPNQGIAECGIINGAVSDADIVLLHTYLDGKWDITP